MSQPHRALALIVPLRLNPYDLAFRPTKAAFVGFLARGPAIGRRKFERGVHQHFNAQLQLLGFQPRCIGRSLEPAAVILPAGKGIERTGSGAMELLMPMLDEVDSSSIG